MAEALLVDLCAVCLHRKQSVHDRNLRGLRCGHPVCRECSAQAHHPKCRLCVLPMSTDSRPQSFAELNPETYDTIPHTECEEKTERCSCHGPTRRCHHCSLHLCAEHVRHHGQLILASAADDERTLQSIRQQIAQQVESSASVAANEEFRLFKELALTKLDCIAQAVQSLDDLVRRPVAEHEAQLVKHSQQRARTLADMDRMLEQLRAALASRDPEQVLNAQRIFQYMQSTGACSMPAQCDSAQRHKLQLQADALEAQITAVASALQGLRELRLPSSTSAAVTEQFEAVNLRSNPQLEKRISCQYFSVGPAASVTGSKIVTFESPLDVDCYNVPNQPLVLFVAEANEDESRVTLRTYTEPRMDCKELPIEFIRNQQPITTFQPRRIAVMTARKLIAMTDVRSNQYSRHIFICDFTGLSGHTVYRIESAKTLNGIHASGNQIYVCDAVDCSVFIVDYGTDQRRHRRIACSGESVPCSVSTRDGAWMLVASEHKVTLYSLEAMLPVDDIQEDQLDLGPGPGNLDETVSTIYRRSSSTDGQYRDVVMLSSGRFIVNTATSVAIYNNDKSLLWSVSGRAVPGVSLEDLMGMCAAERDGRVRLYLCDRRLKQVSVITFDA